MCFYTLNRIVVDDIIVKSKHSEITLKDTFFHIFRERVFEQILRLLL